MSSAAPYRVLVVCTGNICRSPYVERRLRQAVADLALRGVVLSEAVEVTSAGTDALVDLAMDAPMAELLAERGGDPTDHLARALDRELVADADLVLTATRAHRREVVRLLPRASRSVFTLPEFVRLLEDAESSGALVPDDAAETLRVAGEAAADRRGFAEAPQDPELDDIVDPYRRSSETYIRVAAEIDELIARIIAVLERVAVGSER